MKANLQELGKGFDNVLFIPPVTELDLSNLLNFSDILLINESSDTGKMALPSKLTTYMRAGKPIIAATSTNSNCAAEILKSAMFKEEYSQMVVVKDIEVFSMCEHHMLPFFGKAHVAYIPNGYIVGLSKIPRVVDSFARRLQVQERLTNEIRDCIQNTLNPAGVAVVIECKHLCMSMRGIQKQSSVTTTSAFTGEFVNETTRSEFLRLVTASLS
jgi:GTP cyclohydrolase I